MFTFCPETFLGKTLFYPPAVIPKAKGESMPTFIVTDIKWDTDEQPVDTLPLTMCVEAEGEDDLSDAISDIAGFCHRGFSYAQVEMDGKKASE